MTRAQRNPPGADRPDRGAPSRLKNAFIRGLAILLPLVVTLLVVSIVLGFIADAVSPIVTALVSVPGVDSRWLVTAATLGVFAALVVAIGIGAERGTGGRIGEQFDAFMTAIPGIGPLYNSFNEVSDLLLDSDADSFEEVKLVEYPGDSSYVVAFKTAETPARIESATGDEDMVTLFMPMAPNPVMGGFVIHVSRGRVVDVDMTVEEGIRSIVTSGVAIDDGSEAGGATDGSKLERVGDGTYTVASGVSPERPEADSESRIDGDGEADR